MVGRRFRASCTACAAELNGKDEVVAPLNVSVKSPVDPVTVTVCTSVIDASAPMLMIGLGVAEPAATVELRMTGPVQLLSPKRLRSAPWLAGATPLPLSVSGSAA